MYFWLQGSLTFSDCRKGNEALLFPGAIVDASALQVNRVIPQASFILHVIICKKQQMWCYSTCIFHFIYLFAREIYLHPAYFEVEQSHSQYFTFTPIFFK